MAPKETPKLPSHRAQSPSKKPGQSSNRPSNRDGQSSKRGDAPSSRGKKKKGKKKVKAKGEGGDGELEAVDEAAEEEEELEPVAEGGGGGEGGAEFVADLTGLDMGAEGLPVAELPTKLGHLTCAECKLKELPADIGTLELLTKLDANSNELTSLPATIEGCAALETLEVYSNKIKELPASLGKLSKLKVLNAFNNQLRKLPAEIGGLSCLEEVNVAANKLMMLTDKHFSGWAGVTTLSLYENNLVRMGSLAPLVALEELRINGNNLEEMPALSADGHPSLSVLEIHKNRIASIPDDYFKATPALARLSIWGNQLAALPPSLCTCASLVGVQAHENALASLPTEAWPETLETLFVQQNKPLTSLPPALKDCSKLKRINFDKLALDDASAEIADAIKALVLEQSDGIYWAPSGEKSMGNPAA